MKKLLFVLLAALPCLAFSQSDSHLKASEKFVEVSGVKDSFTDVVDGMLKTQISQIPETHRDKFTQVMKEFMAKYFNYGILKPLYVKLYVEEFTEPELNDLTAFYSSSTGKKFANKLGVLTAKGAEFGMKIVKDNQAELERMMREAFGQ